MVVVGDERVDFVVSQWASGREGEDCEEIKIQEGVEVSIDLGELGQRGGRSRL